MCQGRRQRSFRLVVQARVRPTPGGIVPDHTVEQGNPPDAPQLAPAVQRVKKRAGRTPARSPPTAATAKPRSTSQLTDLGVKNVVIPRKGRPSAGAASRGTPKSVPPHHQMAHRQRRPHQLPQTRLRLGPHPHRRHRRRPDLDRTRRPPPTTWPRHPAPLSPRGALKPKSHHRRAANSSPMHRRK